MLYLPHIPGSIPTHLSIFTDPSVPFCPTIFSLGFFFFSTPPVTLLSLLVLFRPTPPRFALRVLRRVGLQPGGPRSRRRGDHHHGDLHHDDGPRASHPAKVRVPRSSRQEDSHLRQPQRSAQVSGGWSVWSTCPSREPGQLYNFHLSAAYLYITALFSLIVRLKE